MSKDHGNNRFKWLGPPQMEKLPNGRYSIVVTCRMTAQDRDWFAENSDNFWRDFGDLYSDDISVNGCPSNWRPQEGEAYDDMRLVEMKTDYIPNEPDLTVQFTYETLTSTWVNEDDDAISSTETGLRRLVRRQVAISGTAAPYDEDSVGVSTITSGGKTLYLAGFEDQTTDRKGVFATQWAEAGLLNADRIYDKEDGILYVKFVSQGTRILPTTLNGSYTLSDEPELAFQGGGVAPIFRKKSVNVEGFKTFETIVMLTKAGGALTDGTVVKDKTEWDNFNYPGYVNLNLSDGIIPVPGGNVAILVQKTETMTTDSTLDALTDVPFSIINGCYVSAVYVPTATGLAEVQTKSFGPNYLAGSVANVGSGTDYLGVPVDSISTSGTSSPSYSGFLATSGAVLVNVLEEDFVTDEGVTWYRQIKETVVGSFNDYI